MRSPVVKTCAGPRLQPHYLGGYRMTIGASLSWRIDQGISRFLIAEGSGYSLPIGRALLTGLRVAQRKGRRIR